MIYEKLSDKFVSSDSNASGFKNNVSIGFESSEEARLRGLLQRKGYTIDFAMERFYKPNLIDISIEADDDPFAGIGDDTGDDSPFADDGGDFGGATDDNPFGDIGGDDNGEFDFGDDGGGEEDGGSKSKKLLLDRKKAIFAQFDISKQIRTNFPKRFLELKDKIASNVQIIERTVVDDIKYERLLKKLIKQYDKITDVIDAYCDNISEQTYDDIFGTYVQIHTNLLKIKRNYLEIVAPDYIKELDKKNKVSNKYKPAVHFDDLSEDDNEDENVSL